MLSEFETKKVDNVIVAFIVMRRPPPHIREDADGSSS